jgi:DNA-binding response OmpR family regulator
MNAQAVKPDRLLEGEDPETVFASDVRHWIAVYREMIGFNEELLGRLEDQVKRLPQAARDGEVDNDVLVIAGQLDRYRRRLGFWYERQWRLEGLDIDHDERTVAYRDRSIAFTRREFQLFVLLVSRSPKFVSPNRLLVEAWHDGQLPEETLRTYIARVRVKLASLGASVVIQNQPRSGYAIIFSEAGGSFSSPAVR